MIAAALTEPPGFLMQEGAQALHEFSGDKTILVVDDEEPIRELVRQHLEGVGYRVLVAENGLSALTLSQRHHGPIHLLLTDVLMPGMTGSVLAGRLAATRPETKVLYISGYTPSTTVHHSIVDQDTALLPKPFTQETLILTVRRILDAHHP
jgi:two-component system cell cycle sensor histidine kinase/response regulator CckA